MWSDWLVLPALFASVRKRGKSDCYCLTLHNNEVLCFSDSLVEIAVWETWWTVALLEVVTTAARQRWWFACHCWDLLAHSCLIAGFCWHFLYLGTAGRGTAPKYEQRFHFTVFWNKNQPSKQNTQTAENVNFVDLLFPSQGRLFCKTYCNKIISKHLFLCDSQITTW